MSTPTTPEQRAELRTQARHELDATTDSPLQRRAVATLALLDERDALAARNAHQIALVEEARTERDEESARADRICARIAELEARGPVVCEACEGEGAVPDDDAQRHSGELCPRKPCPTCAPFGGRGAVGPCGGDVSECPDCGHESRDGGVCSEEQCACNCAAAEAEHEAAVLRARLDALAPTWTPGPPTEPGEWWIRDALSDAEFAATVTAATATGVTWQPVGLPAYAVSWVPRWLAAHAPLLRPQPWRP